MIVANGSHIFFYLFIAATIGVGLYFSRKMDRDVENYFFAGKKAGGFLLGISIYLTILFNSIIIILPSISSQFFSFSTAIIVAAAIIVPMLAGRKLFGGIQNNFSVSRGFGGLFLNLHGLIFLGFFQILLLLQISDSIIHAYFGGSHFALLATMIVAAGIYTLVGGLNAVLYANVMVGILSVAGFIIIFFTSVILKQQIFVSVKSIVQSSADIFHAQGISETNIAVAVIGIALMGFWLIWLEFGENFRKISVSTNAGLKKGIVSAAAVVGTLLMGMFFIFSGEISSKEFASANEITGIDYFVAASFLIGIAGLFALNFQSVGSLIALRLFPLLKREKNEAEQILVGRLSMVFIVLLSILFIPLAKESGGMTLVWYIDFLAYFSTPIVATYVLAAVMNKEHSHRFAGGLIVGELFAVVEYLDKETFVFHLTSMYSFAIEIAIATIVSCVLINKLSELNFFRQLISRFDSYQVQKKSTI